MKHAVATETDVIAYDHAGFNTRACFDSSAFPYRNVWPDINSQVDVYCLRNHRSGMNVRLTMFLRVQQLGNQSEGEFRFETSISAGPTSRSTMAAL